MSAARSTVSLMRSLSAAICLSGILANGACTRTHDLLPRDLGDARTEDAAPGEDASNDDAGLALCKGRPCACANGEDDDGDDLIDGFDPECTGPYDQDEGSFATGEKVGNPLCRDCFFDGNPSLDDDGCRIANSCPVDGTTRESNPSCATCEPTRECVESCRLRTPNGCDCFGCCEISHGGETLLILLVDSCSLADVADEEKCPRCVQSTACVNPCGRCELCAGKTIADVPPDCRADGGPAYSCDQAEVEVCEGPADCEGYCVQGCCAPVLL